MLHYQLQLLAVFLCIVNSRGFFAPWNSYISVVGHSPLELTDPVQAMQDTQDMKRDQPEYFFTPDSQTDPRMVEKRNSGHGQEFGQQGIQISVTANFYVLQQKLRRELLLRVN